MADAVPPQRPEPGTADGAADPASDDPASDDPASDDPGSVAPAKPPARHRRPVALGLALVVILVGIAVFVGWAGSHSPAAIATVGPTASGTANRPTTGPTTSGPATTATADASAAQPSDMPPTASPSPTTPSASPTAPPAPGAPLTLPILYYHKAIPIPADIETWTFDKQNALLRYMVTPCELSAQLDWLVAHDYHPILPADLTAFWNGTGTLPSNPIILTFDDGTPDWPTTVLPLLAARSLRAEFYVTLDHVGTEISWADVHALVDAGMGIGGHDVHHVQLAGGVPDATLSEMRFEVTEAKRTLEAQLGITVDSMAYVGGGYDARLMQVVADAGYSTARSIDRGVTQTQDRRLRLHVSRIGVFDDVPDKSIANARACVLDPSMAEFAARVSGANPG